MGYGSYAGMHCVLFYKHNASHLNQKVIFWSHQSTKHFSSSPLACPHLLMVDSWTWISANVRKAFSCLEFTLGSFTTLRTIASLAFGVIFVGGPLLAWVTVVLNFLHLYTVCQTVDLWSPNTLEMVLLGSHCLLSGLMQKSDYVWVILM